MRRPPLQRYAGSGVLASELSIPVEIHYEMDEDGTAEVTWVGLAEECRDLLADGPRLLWHRLTPEQHQVLQEDAQQEANREQARARAEGG